MLRLFALILAAAILLGLLISRQQRSPAQADAIDAAPVAASRAESAGGIPAGVSTVMAAIKAADSDQLAISEEDGRFLRVLVAARGARSILEIGGASGYSALWLGLGARETGGRVVSIEYDADRARQAQQHIERAGLADVVQVVSGDAFEQIPALPGTFDLVFPRLDPGGVFVAHNVVNKRDEMRPFLETIETHPALFTTIVSPSGEGMSVSYRVR